MAAYHSRKMFANLQSLIKKSTCQLFLEIKNRSNVISLSVSTSPPFYRIYISPIKYSKPRRLVIEQEEDEDEDEDDEVELEVSKRIQQVLDRKFLGPSSGHQVFVIQPYIKWGPNKKTNTTPQLQLLESVALIKTLRHWKVVSEIILPLERFGKKAIFKKGNLKLLTDMINSRTAISAVFLSVNTLTLLQQNTLQDIFGVPVFDRYSIIMHIFKEHAHTKEAKLQVQLAQLSYLKPVLRAFNTGIGEKLGVTSSYVGGEGLRALTDRMEALKLKEVKLKKKILEVREIRQKNRENRGKNEIPVVAIVGYTNAGKTCLIKALTGKESLQPEDYLFATLDVTSYLGELPSGLKAYFVDTLGFINDIPTNLFESFIATLEDATLADVIVHVRDISHPDTVAQNDNVMEVLRSLSFSEESLKNIITVGNKIDLVDRETLKNFEDMIFVSSTNFTGIDVLRAEIEKKILMFTDNMKMVIRVESGSEEYIWLSENSTIVGEIVDEKNQQFTKVQVIISSVNLAKFKHKFIKNYKKL